MVGGPLSTIGRYIRFANCLFRILVDRFTIKQLPDPQHPRPRSEIHKPVLDRRDPSQVFLDMLFSQDAGGNFAAGAVANWTAPLSLMLAELKAVVA